MIAICDNDVVAKLAQFSLLQDFLTHLRKQKLELQLQPNVEATFDLKNKSGTLKKLSSEAQRKEIAALVQKSQTVQLSAQGDEFVEMCHLVEGIDPGDAVWLGVGASTPGSMIFTGDKRALRAVSRETVCRPIAERLAGRVVCFEQIVLALFDEAGYPVLRSRIRAAPEVDISVCSAFPAATVTRADATAKLGQFIERLRSEVGALLHP